MKIKTLKTLSLCSLVVLLPACTGLGLATGVGASAGIAVSQEGGFRRAVTDAKIQAQINDAWFRYDLKTFSKLDMTVNQGRVLLTGVVQDPESRVEAVRLAWQPDGVQQVINEIKVGESSGIMGYARDSWISTRLRTAITLDKEIQSINYTIDTVQGTVYLMGVAQDQAELNRVIETARTISDVRRVVSYVKIAGPNGTATQNEVNQASASSAPTSSNYTSSRTGSGTQQDFNSYYRDDSAPYTQPEQINGAYVTEVKPVLEQGSPNPALQDGPIQLSPVSRQNM